ncbi:MurR/RpiR family transcriptional regulator, partial [Blautia faecis]|nr:MurR/RpiR family transcriptional regulator [Blautia faecis]
EGISRIPVDYLEKLLFSIGRQNVYKYKSSRLAAHIASNANEDDILIAISTSGNYPTTVKIVKLFNLNHAT